MTALPVVGGAGRIQIYAATDHSPVRWRLLSGNHREVARSVAGYRNRAACLVAVEAARGGIRSLVPAVRRTPEGQWLWQLLYGAQPVIQSAHPFDRQIRCEQSLEQFVACIADAQVSAATLVSHARRWEQRALRTAPPRLQRERLR